MRHHLAFGHRIWKRNYINMNEWFKIYVYQETRFAAKLWETINIITWWIVTHSQSVVPRHSRTTQTYLQFHETSCGKQKELYDDQPRGSTTVRVLSSSLLYVSNRFLLLYAAKGRCGRYLWRRYTSRSAIGWLVSMSSLKTKFYLYYAKTQRTRLAPRFFKKNHINSWLQRSHQLDMSSGDV